MCGCKELLRFTGYLLVFLNLHAFRNLSSNRITYFVILLGTYLMTAKLLTNNINLIHGSTKKSNVFSHKWYYMI